MASTLRESMAEVGREMGIRPVTFDIEPRGFFGVGIAMPDGTVQEFGGKGRKWSSVRAFHADRAGREASLIVHFPAEEDS